MVQSFKPICNATFLVTHCIGRQHLNPLLMDMLITKNYYYIHLSQALSPIQSPQNSAFLGPPLNSSNTSFPILAVAIIGILATALLLVSYYIFVIKCCLNWHHIDLLSNFPFSRNHHPHEEDQLGLHSANIENRGLEDSVIQSIPIFQFKGEDKKGDFGERMVSECSVCLNDFQEEEKVRVIPNCAHIFHVDCIDVWLQRNVNCPLCRTRISITAQFPFIVSPSSSPQYPNPSGDNFMGRDEDYVVIELGEGAISFDDQRLFRAQERLNLRELPGRSSISPSPRKFGNKIVQKKVKKMNHVSSFGDDEFIDIRERDDQFAIQPMRRSFSMDSADDRLLRLAVEEITQQNRNVNEVNFSEVCSSRVQRSFFSFGNGRGYRP